MIKTMFEKVAPGRLLAIIAVGLFLAAGSLPASAQTIPPTSPCTAGLGSTPPGWTNDVGSPDCSTTTHWAGRESDPWNDSPIPVTPDGHATFATMIGAVNNSESIKTMMTDLIPGRQYRIAFFGLPSPLRTLPGCLGLNLRTTGAAENVSLPSSGQWSQRVFVFTAVSASQQLWVAAWPDSGGSGNCFVNFVLGSDVIEIIKTDDGQMFGNPDAELVSDTQHPCRHVIVTCKNGGWAFRLIQQLPGSGNTTGK